MTGIYLQALRYGVVGVASNLLLYLLYLAFSLAGLEPKTAMSVTYGIGVIQTFLLNKRWTFSHRGRLRNSSIRYLLVYALGYLLNLGILFALVDCAGLPHQAVQAGAILCVAAILFLLQRHWVFQQTHSGEQPGSASPDVQP